MQKQKLLIGGIARCLDDKYTKKQLESIPFIPKKDEYYTIRDIEIYPESNVTAIRLSEIKNPILGPPAANFKEPSFSITRFEIIPLPKIITDEL
jgi:hypothetical protein